jgi:D-inositol-3-phosphate glycosyltransferase
VCSSCLVARSASRCSAGDVGVGEGEAGSVAGADVHHDDRGHGQAEIIERMLRAHPGISVVANWTTPSMMAALMARHDIVVMPSNSQYWHETFGIVSVEAQHSGCWVLASDDGGLPETDCGEVVLVRPENAEALAWGIREAADSGPLPTATRHDAGVRFTVRSPSMRC